MYSMENYFWGSLGYILGVLMVLPLVWRCTRALPWHPLRAGIRVLVLAVLLTPARPYPDKIFLAPAWAVAVFEVIQPTTVEGPLKGVLPITTYFLGLLALELIIWSLWTQLRSPRPMPTTTAGGRARTPPAAAAGPLPAGGTDNADRRPPTTAAAAPISAAHPRRDQTTSGWGNIRQPGEGKNS